MGGVDLRMRRTLRIRRRVLDEVMAHAAEASPSECCGLLIGTAHAVEQAWRARNLEDAPSAYLIDPADHFAAIRLARGARMDVIGAYHSHPASVPVPSKRDVAEALPGFVYLIVTPVPGAPVPVRAFWLEAGRVDAIELIAEE
jgi:desampylase